MNKLLAIWLALILFAAQAAAGESVGFVALKHVEGAALLDSQELSDIEATTLFYGAIRIPVYFESVSAFMNEVLATLLRIDGRSPVVTYTINQPVFTLLPTGGITVGVQSNTYILVKTLICMVCTKL